MAQNGRMELGFGKGPFGKSSLNLKTTKSIEHDCTCTRLFWVAVGWFVVHLPLKKSFDWQCTHTITLNNT